MIIDSEEIFLKPIEVEDTDDIIKWRNSDVVRHKFLDQNDFTREGHLKWLSERVMTGQVAQFIICVKPENCPVGSAFLRDIDYKNKKAEFGIFIGEDFARGRGIGTKTAKLIIRHGFETLKLHKIFLRVLADNINAVKSYKKAGFTQEAYLKDEVILDGRYRDIILMAVLNNAVQAGDIATEISGVR